MVEFQSVGAANLKALRPTALAVEGTCNRLSEAERRGLGGLLRLISDERYEGAISKGGNFEVNTLLNRKPMKLVKSNG